MSTGADAAEKGRQPLTETEHALLLAVVRGLTNAEASKLVGISEGTVKVYLGKIYKKIGVAGRDRLVEAFRRSHDSEGGYVR